VRWRNAARTTRPPTVWVELRLEGTKDKTLVDIVVTAPTGIDSAIVEPLIGTGLFLTDVRTTESADEDERAKPSV
jgi:hypothetical protein